MGSSASGSRNPKKLNRDKVKQLMACGVSEIDIAKHQGVQPSSIHRYIHTLPEVEVEDYKAKRADSLALSQLKAIAVKNRVFNHVLNMDDQTFSALSEQSKIAYAQTANISAGTDFDKERLERGQSTQNVTHLHAVVRELQRSEQSSGTKQESGVSDTPEIIDITPESS